MGQCGNDEIIFTRQFIIFKNFMCSLKELASQRREQLENSLTLQQFYCDLDEEETWIK